jgi:hypothetical protein
LHIYNSYLIFDQSNLKIMRKILLSIFIFLYAVKLMAFNPEGDTSWKSKYEASLGFSQTTFTNWSAGGDNSYSINSMLNIYKNYAKGKISWNNYLGLAYGVNYNKSTTPNVRKTNDKINFLTKGGIYAWNHWDYAGTFEFRSQFDEGFDYSQDSAVKVSKFMAPGYFQFSIGMNYKPVDYFFIFISPIGARLTVVNDKSLTGRPEGAYGIFGDNTALWQVGGSVNVGFKKDILKNVNLMSKLDLFSDYRNHPEKIIVGWENNILMKVNKYISLNLSTMLIRDHNITFVDKNGNSQGVKTQFRETFSLGLTYTMAH